MRTRQDKLDTITAWEAAMPAMASTGQSVNDAIIDFVDSPAGVVRFFGIWDAAKDGHFLAWGSMEEDRRVVQGDTYRLPVGNIMVRSD